MTGFIWIRTGTTGMPLWMPYWHFEFRKCRQFGDWLTTVRISRRISTPWSLLPVSYLFSLFVISYWLCISPRVTQTAYEFNRCLRWDDRQYEIVIFMWKRNMMSVEYWILAPVCELVVDTYHSMMSVHLCLEMRTSSELEPHCIRTGQPGFSFYVWQWCGWTMNESHTFMCSTVKNFCCC